MTMTGSIWEKDRQRLGFGGFTPTRAPIKLFMRMSRLVPIIVSRSATKLLCGVTDRQIFCATYQRRFIVLASLMLYARNIAAPFTTPTIL